METHLDRVDRSLEELTKKVQKHVAYKTSEIDTNNNENNNENKTGNKFLNTILKPPYIFIIGLPMIYIILLLYLQPSFVKVIDPNDKKKQYVSFKKLMLWSIVFSSITGIIIYYFFFKEKNTENKKIE